VGAPEICGANVTCEWFVVGSAGVALVDADVYATVVREVSKPEGLGESGDGHTG